MVAIIIIAAAGVFVLGVAVGIVLVASYGIRREERQGPFFADEATDGVNWAARRLNGLYVRHQPAPVRRDADLGTRI
jgi:hypothetical protein